MVLTRSQTKLQSEKMMMVKEFSDNMIQMSKDFVENKGTLSEKMQSIIPIFEYNNKMLDKIHFNEPTYIKGLHAKCGEFQQEHLNGKYDKLEYKLVCDFLQTLKNSQHLVTKLQK